MFKRIILSLVLLLSFTSIFVFDSPEASTVEQTGTTSEVESVSSGSEISPMGINSYRTRKVNVTTTEEWSSYKRVSDNLNTWGSQGGSISSNKSYTFSAEVDGNISGLGITLGGSVSSQIGYTLNVGPNQAVYMGFRTKYKVERGTREVYDTITGRIQSSNKYTVKKPLYGTYKLLSY